MRDQGAPHPAEAYAGTAASSTGGWGTGDWGSNTAGPAPWDSDTPNASDEPPF